MLKEIIIQGICAIGIATVAITTTFCLSIISVGGIDTLKCIINNMIARKE